ncbi:Small glutamine-rich tetratricopeptide repeat-containing protein 2 [Candida viswanathii]|uniref:Small glutamine-rich tetratricopeptide repeat-containing protein 2 n=1 Tax=Candida viswanathii TaxID=5486 RepID=A0A367YM47_9ASCO|nr:Small glutamine-rich tetratricopeptide repeat-containing protein 2 [Candida viswanathii]
MPSTISNKDVALSIINFLKESVAKKQVAEDYAESMDVAIDCIADAFEVDKDDDSKVIKDVFNGKSLSELLQSLDISATGSSEVSTSSESPVEVKEVDAETRAKADELKLQGNRAMAQKDYPEAISKYTEAIALDPTNVVYLSNRAAAHSSYQKHDKAVEDAEKAIKLNPEFSKAYSRLGLAKYALGDAKGAMEAYKKGLDAEGENKSDAMRKGYETAKKRVEEDLESSISTTDRSAGSDSGASAGAGAGAGAGGLPDLSSFMGGGGGMPNLSEMMNNPQIMQAAQEMMSNPQAMQDLFNNPAVRQMAQQFGMGGDNAPDLSNIMNNPMFNQFMGGNGRGSGSGNSQGGSSGSSE